MTHQHERRDDGLTGDEVKLAMRDAIKEWLDEKFAEFGWWSAKALAALVFAALIYFVLSQNGWHKGP